MLQEVFAAAFNAILADEREINVRPWLYRIARNRSLNHLRRAQAVGVDSMDVHLSEGGLTTADKVHTREEFRQLMGDVQELPETQRTALLLREIDALSYDQIAEAMETTVPSVKSLLVRARVSLAEAAEARLLTCEEVRRRARRGRRGPQAHDRPGPPPPAHAASAARSFRKQLRQTNKALASILPVGAAAAAQEDAARPAGHDRGRLGRQRRRRRGGDRRRARPAVRAPAPSGPARAPSRPRPSPASRRPRSSPPAPSRSSTPRCGTRGARAARRQLASTAPKPPRPRSRGAGARSRPRRSRSPPRRRRRDDKSQARARRCQDRQEAGRRRRAGGNADADARARAAEAPRAPNRDQHDGDTTTLPTTDTGQTISAGGTLPPQAAARR